MLKDNPMYREMRIKNDAKVTTADDKDAGHVDRVVLNPQTKEVTHVVVRQGFLFTEDKVLPIETVASATDDGVTLNVRSEELKDLPLFEETHYVPLDDAELRGRYDYYDPMYAAPLYWYPPTATGAGLMLTPYEYGVAGQQYTTATERNIPDDTVALKEGATVITADDKKVGRVAEVLTDSTSGRVTGLVIEKGLLLKEEKLVPISWVRRVGEKEVGLAVGSELLERLRPYQHPEQN